ncbi:MAG: hypothetical protein ACFB2W_20105 [Leptolyngbyaceae cyanobacterium]
MTSVISKLLDAALNINPFWLQLFPKQAACDAAADAAKNTALQKLATPRR